MRISRKACLGAVAAATLIASAALSAAQASSILTFGQAGGGGTTTFTESAGSTTIVDSNVGVTVTQILAGVSVPFSAIFNLTATSVGSATTVLGAIAQRFQGSFSVTSASCGAGNCLSGTFSDVVLGSGSSAVLSVAEPPDTVSFTSNVITQLGQPLGMSLAFTGLANALAIVDGSIGSNTASSVSGNFSATPIPGALPLFGTALGALGLFGWRKKRRAQANSVFAAAA